MLIAVIPQYEEHGEERVLIVFLAQWKEHGKDREKERVLIVFLAKYEETWEGTCADCIPTSI